MINSGGLLGKVTELLAYAGDEEAQDGYLLNNNSYSIAFRSEPLSQKQLKDLLKKVKGLLKKNTPLSGIPDNIHTRVMELKDSYESSEKKDKDELLEYLEDLEIGGMRGGTHKYKRSRKSRSSRKLRKNSKTKKSNKKN